MHCALLSHSCVPKTHSLTGATQRYPLPKKPALQEQSYPPRRSSHVAFEWHRCDPFSHSSISSSHLIPFPKKPFLQEHEKLSFSPRTLQVAFSEHGFESQGVGSGSQDAFSSFFFNFENLKFQCLLQLSPTLSNRVPSRCAHSHAFSSIEWSTSLQPTLPASLRQEEVLNRAISPSRVSSFVMSFQVKIAS